VDANSHTNFSLPPARALLYFISPPSFLPKIQKANPCLLCRLTFPTISQTLTPPFFLSPSIYLRLSLCRLLFLSLWRNGSGRRRRRTGPALPPSLVKLSEFFFSSSSDDLKAWDAEFVKVDQATWSPFFLINSNPPVRSFFIIDFFSPD
jgi:hypothetical protein